MKSKGELYTSIVEMHQRSGQGMSGLIPAYMPNVSTWMDELIQEGLIKEHDSGGTLGHPMSNRWYYPTQGYSVWDREKPMLELSFVRFYLGLVGEEAESIVENSFSDFSRNPERLEMYLEWLKINKSELEVMLSISPFYKSELNSEIVDKVKEKGYYKSNRKVSEVMNIVDEIISVSNQLIKLYGSNAEYATDLEKAEKDVIDCKSILSILRELENKGSIQEELEKYEKSFENA